MAGGGVLHNWETIPMHRTSSKMGAPAVVVGGLRTKYRPRKASGKAPGVSRAIKLSKPGHAKTCHSMLAALT